MSHADRALAPASAEGGVRYNGRYCVEFDGELIVVGSRDPECDVARALLARGITGKLTMVDANTDRPRTVIDIERAAKLTVQGGYFVKFKEKPIAPAPAAEDEVVLPTYPTGVDEGCLSPGQAVTPGGSNPASDRCRCCRGKHRSRARHRCLTPIDHSV